MTGALALSHEYFEKYALPSLRERFPELLTSLAAGLVGNGSECFGYDDEISHDHDWGVDFFLWLPEGYAARIPELAAWKAELLETHPPEFPRTKSEYGARVGIETVGGFYRSLIGYPEGPKTLNDWVNIPEENLAMAVNGEIFLDNSGEFTKTREYLLEFFPEDLRLKRLSHSCMMMAQGGQYNFGRCAARGDVVAARSALSQFSDAVIAALFLLKRRYRPYYKWRYHAALEFAPDGILTALAELADAKISAAAEDIARTVERICRGVAYLLREEGLITTQETFFTAHGEELRARIAHDKLRELPAQYEI